MRNFRDEAIDDFCLAGINRASCSREGDQITSPDHAYTFAYGAVFSHQVEREPLTNQLIANVTFSNYPCTGDRQPRCDDLRFSFSRSAI